MKLDTENIDDDDGAFMQIAFDDHPDGIELEYREGVDTPLYHCRRPVLRPPLSHATAMQPQYPRLSPTSPLLPSQTFARCSIFLA